MPLTASASVLVAQRAHGQPGGSTRPASRRAGQPVGVRGVDEQLVRAPGDQHVRVGAGTCRCRGAPAASARSTSAACGGVGEGLAEHQPAPAAVEHDAAVTCSAGAVGSASARDSRCPATAGLASRKYRVTTRSRPAHVAVASCVPSSASLDPVASAATSRADRAARACYRAAGSVPRSGRQQLGRRTRPGTGRVRAPPARCSASRTRSRTLPSRWVMPGTGK